MFKKIKIHTGIALALLISLPVDMVSSQSVIEEITVTARQREESLREVPAAITVLTESQIERSGIQRATDFIALTPGVTIVDTAEVGDTQVSIRGLNGARDAETSFGLIIDGIVMTNPAALNREYLGLSQIEVLKGPQGALYGRNASAGAIIITTAKPGEERGGAIKASVGDDATYAITARADIPMENHNLSIIANHNSTDGFRENTWINCDDCVDNYESTDVYARMTWDMDENTSMDAKLRYGEVDTSSIVFNAVFQLPAFEAYLGIPTLYEDVNTHTFDFVSNFPHTNNQESLEFSLKMEKDLGWANLTAWTLYSDIENEFAADGTSGAFGFFFADASCLASLDEIVSSGQGFSLPSPQYIATSDPSVPNGLLLGPYTPTRCDGTQYQRRNQDDLSFEVRISSPSDQAIRWSMGAYALNVNREVGVNQGTDLGNGVVMAMYDPKGGLNPTEQMVWDDFSNNVHAFFGSVDIDLTDTIELSLAGRYDKEKRQVHNLVPTNVTSTYIDCDGFPYTGGPLNTGLCNASSIPDQEKTFEHFQPKISLSWAIDDNASFYVSWGEGFKSGGFNNSGARQTIDTFINPLNPSSPINLQDSYDKEVNASTEVGFKALLADNRVSLDLSVYKTNAENLQFFEFIVGPFGLLRIVENIDESELSGGEIAVTAIVNDNISVYASGAYIDSEVTKNSVRTDSVGNNVPYHADYTFNSGLSLDYPMSNGMNFFAQVDYAVVGPTWFHLMQTNNSRNSLFGAPMAYDKTDRARYDTVNLRLGVELDNMTIVAFAKNLTDEDYLAEVIPAAEFGGVFAHPGPQRRLGLEISYQF
ncbi:MAG: TonB-dependent receptor [Gammaproteobacteria bacterium]|nr:TonB-dependent receptor [Gammaproteobacteria bacterium]